jgi:hypothetical protein
MYLSVLHAGSAECGFNNSKPSEVRLDILLNPELINK